MLESGRGVQRHCRAGESGEESYPYSVGGEGSCAEHSVGAEFEDGFDSGLGCVGFGLEVMMGVRLTVDGILGLVVEGRVCGVLRL